MHSNDETIIATSKKKIVLLLLGAGAFVVIGTWMFLRDDASMVGSPISFPRSIRLTLPTG
jgi:hypothetical protein